MKFLPTLFIQCCICSLLLVSCKAQFGTITNLESQLNEIVKEWPGTYNNDIQIESIKKEGKDVWLIDDTGKNGYLHLQSHYIKIDKPEIGDHVLYVEEYRDHQPKETYRQRIYTLFIDKESNMIKVKMWPFKDKKKFVGAWNNPDLLKSITKEDVSAYPDFCDMHVKKVGNKYHMAFNGKDCAFGDKCFNYEVLLSKDMFSYRDKITELSSGKIISTAANFAYHNLNRIK